MHGCVLPSLRAEHTFAIIHDGVATSDLCEVVSHDLNGPPLPAAGPGAVLPHGEAVWDRDGGCRLPTWQQAENQPICANTSRLRFVIRLLLRAAVSQSLLQPLVLHSSCSS
jgi:hypothetical protein